MTIRFERKQMKTFVAPAVAVALCVSMLAGKSAAVSVPITNYSFETPSAAGTYVLAPPDGWGGNPGANIFIEDIAAVGMSGGDGLQYLGLDNDGAYITQDLGVPFQAGMTYRVDLASAHRSGFTHGIAEFGVYSSNAIGTDLGTVGFMDLQGVWSGSGNPDGDDMYDVFRDASVLQTIGSGALGRTSKFSTGSTPPTGNVVVYIRKASGARVNLDNIRLDVSPSLLAGDVDDDGDVDLDDFNAIRDHFRTSVAARNLGDLTEDGRVGFDDFREWKNNYPFPLTGLNLAFLQGVPEPASWTLCGLALSVACGYRRFAGRRRN